MSKKEMLSTINDEYDWTEETYARVKAHCIADRRPHPSSRAGLDVAKWFMFPKNIKFYFDHRDKPLKETYKYMITFTLAPASVSKEKEIEKFIISQSERKALKLKNFYYVKEYTKNKVPHWHVVLESEAPIKKNRFQYYERSYGHVDISRTKGQTIQEALQYISKEGDPIKLL